MENLHSQLTYNLRGAFFEVAREMGPGLLEKCYQDALEAELKLRNIPYEREKHIEIFYKGQKLPSDFYMDFLIDGKVVVELKSVEELCDAHRAQVINYLRLSECDLGLLVNFRHHDIKVERLVNYFDYE